MSYENQFLFHSEEVPLVHVQDALFMQVAQGYYYYLKFIFLIIQIAMRFRQQNMLGNLFLIRFEKYFLFFSYLNRFCKHSRHFNYFLNLD